MSRWAYERIRPLVSAVQWRGDNLDEIREFFADQGPYQGGEPIGFHVEKDNLDDLLLQFGWQNDDIEVEPGWWIVLEADDEMTLMGSNYFGRTFIK